MKHCNKCGLDKAASEFHKRSASVDGLAACCKECQRAYDQARKDDEGRKKHRAEYAKGKGKQVSNEAKRRYIERNPKVRAAHVMVGNAIRDGRLHKRPCEKCGAIEVQAHHDDYNKPLTVRWLCPAHHQEWHEEHGEGANK